MSSRPQADPEAAARRAAARRERVTGGLDELSRWLRDQVRSGLSGLERAGYRHFDQVAARLVDAQAPGVANLVRALPGELAGESWPERVLEQFGALHLLIEAHRRLDELPPDLAATVRSRIGYPVSKGEVLRSPGVPDRWQAVGSVDTVEYRLESRRVWLYGADTGRWALLLSFAPPGGVLDATVAVGMELSIPMHFYPGSGQYRALVGEGSAEPTRMLTGPPGLSCADLLDRFAALLTADPWAARMPAVLRAVPVPPPHPGLLWRLRDSDGTCVQLDLPTDPWPLLAQSGGDPVTVFGEWGPYGFRPLSILADPGRHQAFTTDLLGQAA